jgi:hypothetical protein
MLHLSIRKKGCTVQSMYTKLYIKNDPPIPFPASGELVGGGGDARRGQSRESARPNAGGKQVPPPPLPSPTHRSRDGETPPPHNLSIPVSIKC